MPLTAEQLAALENLFAGDAAPLKGATPDDVAEGLRTKAPTVYTVAFNAGAKSRGDGEDGKLVKRLRKDLERVEQERDTLKQQMASGAPPEVKKQIDDLTTEVTTLRQKLKDAEEAHEAAEQSRAESEVFSGLATLLEDPSAGNLRKTFAKAVLVDPDLRKRIKVERKDDGSRRVVVYQAGKTIPLAAEDDTEGAMLKALAKEIHEHYKTAEPDAIKSPVDAGGGVTTGGSGGDQAYDPAAEGKAMAKAQKGENEGTKGLAYR